MFDDWLSLLAVPALVALNGFFVAAEYALVSLRMTRIEELVQQGAKGAKSVESAVAHLDRTIAATQLGITLASIVLGAVGEPALTHVVEPLFASLPDFSRAVATHSTATIIALTLITFMHVLFGELFPKTLALQLPDRTALLLARPLNVFTRLSGPFTWILNVAANALSRLCGLRRLTGEESAHSLEELSMLIEDTAESGLIDSDQADFVQNVFQLSNKKVRDCMIPCDRMASLELSTPSDRILEAVRQGAHTRMPVYDGKPDNIVGVVNTKNLFYLFSLQGVVVLEDALYPATFLDPDESLANALRLFRRSRRPLALVRDGEGHILGLLTLEDVLEEIVGDIEDEHDRPMATVKLKRKPIAPKPKPAAEVLPPHLRGMATKPTAPPAHGRE